MSVQQNWEGSGLIFRTLGGLFTGETSPEAADGSRRHRAAVG